MSDQGRDSPTPPDDSRIRPYGDTLDDGQVQLSFTLPIPCGPRAREAARRLVRNMGLEEPKLYHVEDLGENYTFFVVYARCEATVDFEAIDVASVETETMSYAEINDSIREKLGRKVVVLGACTGTDAHSVGIDAIMNPKGYGGEYGLERYPMLQAHNLGMQFPND